MEKSQIENEGLYYKISRYEGATQLAIVFSTVGVKPGYFTFFKTMESLPVHKIYLTDPNSEWFQSGILGLGSTIEETIERIKSVQEELGVTEIMTIGSSMGAFGAILFGALLNCRVLAFGARIELGIPGSQSYTLMNKGFQFKYKDLRPVVKESNCQILLYQGEADKNDILAAKQLYGYDNVECVTIRGVAHGTPVFLNNKFGITEVIRRFINKDPILEFKERGNLCECDNAVELLLDALDEISNKNWTKAFGLLNSVQKMCPESDVVYHKLGIINYQFKEFEAAAKNQSLAIQISPHFANAHHQLGICQRKLGQYEESYQSHKNAYEIDPKLPSAHYHAGLSLEKLKRFDEAENEYREAINISQNNVNFKKKLIEILHVNVTRKLIESEELMLSLLPK
ncbi:tetratricopeptide repeat protein [Bacillus sp. V2I10]|uniref:tetratricopeptide repeat protein n=1 Tax=Bacillus sp. V2I10 TaxID=3042276 RepID=UPI0027886731|nr:tetratricopeptide repeat protein [Bacillus sp. V2I10]MDQ0857209.1 hypothetical protein [Bacillus sp. V2I10]